MYVRNAWYVAAWDHEITREMRRRMRSLQQSVESNTVHDWANRYLAALGGEP